MAITTLDPRTALIVIDLQKGVVGLPFVHPITEVVRKSVDLVERFRHLGLPVVLVNVVATPPGRTEQSRFRAALPEGFADLVPELTPQPGDHLVSKRTAGAFTGTGLETYLREKGVTQVVIAGVATSMGVESTARQAQELSFNVTLAVDAMGDTDAEVHDVVLAKVFPRLGETGSCAEILALLGERRT